MFQDGGETTLAACFAAGRRVLGAVELTGRQVAISIATAHAAGHPKSWIIALPEAPFTHRALDYGLRRGIEVMFSDIESCGFGLEGSRIPHPDRLARLLLVTALALHWAVSTGMWEPRINPFPPKKAPGQRPRKLARCHPSGASGGTDGR